MKCCNNQGHLRLDRPPSEIDSFIRVFSCFPETEWTELSPTVAKRFFHRLKPHLFIF